MLFRQPNTIGMLLDISPQRYEKRPLLEYVKKSLIKLVRDFEDDDVFYLYTPDAIDTYLRRGQRVAALANYATDGYKFDLVMAVKQTLFVVAAGDPDGDRMVVIVTDRLNAEQIVALEKAFMINERDGFGLKYIVVGLGENYDRALVSKTCLEAGAVFIHLDDPNLISQSLSFVKQEFHVHSENPQS
jgi:hypothetical protein